jgi:hypothetical protein
MSTSIPDPLWVYRIVHYKNLNYILQNGIYSKAHVDLDPNYISIGNFGIINIRADFDVKIEQYGQIGDYVPFYFGKQSIMLYNVLTDTNVTKHAPEDIVYLCCRVDKLASDGKQYFFTDGQANKKLTSHYNNLKDLSSLDWETITGTDFKNSEEDPDKKRRYQAEFLVYRHVPISCIGAIVVYNKPRKTEIEELLKENNIPIPIGDRRDGFYFHF